MVAERVKNFEQTKEMKPNQTKLKYKKVTETKKTPTEGGGVLCFDCPENVTVVVFGHLANLWKRTVSQAQSCLSSHLPTVIVLQKKGRLLCKKKQMNIRIMY